MRLGWGVVNWLSPAQLRDVQPTSAEEEGADGDGGGPVCYLSARMEMRLGTL